jgi:Domain of unknown function (DUF4263)
MPNLAVEFFSQDNSLFLRYEPRGETTWVRDLFKRDEPLIIKKTFHFTKANLVEEQTLQAEDEWSFDKQDTVSFRVATLVDDYFHFDREVLDLDVDLLIHKDIELTYKHFTAEQRISVFRIIAKLKPQRIVIGGPAPDAIPEASFNGLIKNFPSGLELYRYSLARVSSVVREYVETAVDGESLHTRYVNKRLRKSAKDLVGTFKESELQKYRFLHSRLVAMLGTEAGYNETAWQAEILQIILLLNPKYIKAVREAPVRDSYQNTTRRIDILLIDAAGHIDIVEIKKPFEQSILTNAVYRDNYIPLRELSGTVMQIEKYLFHLNKWGQQGEDTLTKAYAYVLPTGFRVKISNPSGIIIMGRDNNLSEAQRMDFEVVKRKYKNIIDIVTYDDLLRRLDFIVKQLETDA